jgi:hypothetical protein
MRRIICVMALGFVALAPTAADAHDGGSLKHRDKYLRAQVIKVSNKRAPGCDLVLHKCPKGTKTTVKEYFATLRRMAAPPPPRPVVVATSSTTSTHAPVVSNGGSGATSYHPTTTATSTPTGGSSAERFVGCESGGSWTAVNPSSGAYGRYQILPSHWGAGGQCQGLGRDPGGQTECANRIMATEGSGAWAQCGG